MNAVVALCAGACLLAGTAQPVAAQSGVPTIIDLPVKPVAPTAEPATQSLTLQQAYRMMATGNPYQYEQAQAMLAEGLREQDAMNEAAARRQQAREMSYQAAVANYAAAVAAQLSAQYADRSAAIGPNYAMQNAAAEEGYNRRRLLLHAAALRRSGHVTHPSIARPSRLRGR